MNKAEMFKLIKELPFDQKRVIYKEGKTELFLLRPSKLKKRFEKYDRQKNFQLKLNDGYREFIPNHLRVLIDLNLRVRSRPDLKRELLLAFDNIFYGKDPEKELMKLSQEHFEHFLNPLIAIGHCAQVFIIEQEWAYNKVSKYEPTSLFFQGWVREFIDNTKEIDNLCMSVCNRQSPLANYTKLENKKHKRYQTNLGPLWYLEDSKFPDD